MSELVERAEQFRREWTASRTVARKVAPLDDIDDLDSVADLFPAWAAGVAVSVGDVVRHDGVLWRCVQAHTTQSDWTPDVVPALFALVRDSGGGGSTPDPWVQPQGTHDAYQIGDRVTHNGQTWESTHANNAWEPGVFGWQVV